MSIRKPLVIVSGEIQRLHAGDTLDTSNLFDAATNLGNLSTLTTSGITVHNGTAFSTITLTAPLSGMTITNPDGVVGNPIFAFTDELASLLALSTGIVARTGAGILTTRTITGTTNQITVTNGDGIAGDPVITITSNPTIPGTASLIVPTGATGDRPGTPSNGMMRYNTTLSKFEFYQGGVWVQYGTGSGAGTVTSVSTTQPVAGLSITGGPITTSGTFVFTLTDDLAALEGLAGTGLAVRTATSTWTNVTITGTAGNISISNGDGILGPPTIDLVNAGTPIANSHVRITTDTKGRVTASSAVQSTDIITALGYTPVNKAGDTMVSGANLTFVGGGEVLGLPSTPSGATAATSKAYVDNLVTSGTVWVGPIQSPDLVGIISTAGGPGVPINSGAYIAYGGSYPDTWNPGSVTVNAYDLVHYSGGIWHNIFNINSATPTRMGVGINTSGVDASLTTPGIFQNDLVSYIGGIGGDPTLSINWNFPHGRVGGVTFAVDSVDSGSKTWTLNSAAGDVSTSFHVGNRFTYAGGTASNGTYTIASSVFSSPNTLVVVQETVASNSTGGTVEPEIKDGTTTIDNNVNDQHYGVTTIYSATSNVWTEIAGPGTISAGTGLSYSGTTLNINLGAGIIELPTDEIGIDLYDTVTGAIILTTDGTTRSTVTGAKLHLLLNGSSLTQGASGLSVASNGITEAMLNTSVAGAGLSGGGGSALAVNVDNSSIEINVDTLRVKAGGITNVMMQNTQFTFQTDGGSASIGLGGSGYFKGLNGLATSVSTTTNPNDTFNVTLTAGIDNLSDVTITTVAAGDILYRNVGNTQFINAQPGSASGVQPYDNTLQALAGLTANPGDVVTVGTDSFTTRILTGTARIVVINGDGVAGDPSFDLASSVATPGTYTSVTVDTYGRVTAGTTPQANTLTSLINSNAGTVVFGAPVYISSATHFDKAQANAAGTSNVVGLVSDASIATSATGTVTIEGTITGLTTQWDAVTGQSGGLTSGSVYYLDPATAGKLTVTVPSTAGQYVAPVGLALSTTVFKIHVNTTVLL